MQLRATKTELKDKIKGGSQVVVLPQQGNLIFQHNMTSTTPEVGSYTYTRSGTIVTEAKTGDVVQAGTNTLPLGGGRPGGSEVMTGAWLGGAVRNWLTYSEQFDQWAGVGTGLVTAQSGLDPLGTNNADLISGSTSGDGVEQDTTITAGTNRPFVFSVWLKSNSGSALSVKIRVRDDGNEGGEVICPLTSSWKRFQVPKIFEGGITGSIRVQIIVDNTSDCLAWGAQLEDFNSTSAGRRERFSGANAYVATTAAAVTAGGHTYTIPNSIVSNCTTTGTLSMWVLPVTDPADWTNSHGYAASINQEVFAVVPRPDEGIYMTINNQPRGITNTDALYSFSTDRWNHILVTWDTNNDVYKVFRDGLLLNTNTTASSAINISTNDLHIGRNSVSLAYTHADMFFGPIALWDVALSDAEAYQAFQTHSNDGIRANPGTGKLFSVALGTSPVPTIGDVIYHANHRSKGQPYYADSTTSIAPSGGLVRPVPAYYLNGDNVGGLEFMGGTVTNLMLQSEAPATTWAAVGAPTVTNAVGTFLGTLSYGTIAGTTGEGIEQASGTATASNEFVGSVYMSVASGTLDVDLILQGSTGGTPETTTNTVTVTTTPTRYNVYASFTASATGNCEFQILLGANGTVRLSGMMLEEMNGNQFATNFMKVGSAYVKTTTTTASYNGSGIHYRMSDSINYNIGSLKAWGFNHAQNPTDYIGGNGPTVLGAPGQNNNFYMHHEIDMLDFSAYGQIVNRLNSFTATRGQWKQYVWTWDFATPEFKVYVDGALQQTVTTLNNPTITYMLHRTAMIGYDYKQGAHDSWNGALDLIEIWGSVLTDAEVSAAWTAEKATYGR